MNSTPPPSSRPVSATLAEARRVLAEEVTPGEWIIAGGQWIAADDPDAIGGMVCREPDPKFSPRSAARWPANARVLAAARRSIEANIRAVERCGACGSWAADRGYDIDDPANRCHLCREMLAIIRDATGQTEER